tara:strand:- start:57129 stop:57347 length:219 start_codon:yes stop_codon:yes gene_type:complete
VALKPTKNYQVIARSFTLATLITVLNQPWALDSSPSLIQFGHNLIKTQFSIEALKGNYLHSENSSHQAQQYF